jgi:hypothetical protein
MNNGFFGLRKYRPSQSLIKTSPLEVKLQGAFFVPVPLPKKVAPVRLPGRGGFPRV